MISKEHLAIALRTKAQEITDANSYTLVNAGESYSPTIDEIYITEAPLYGDDNRIGMEDSSSDFQIGLYQLTIHVPRNLTKWVGLEAVDIVQVGFARGTEMISGDQRVRAMNSSLTPLDYNPTHIMYAVRIKYSVIN